MRILTRAGETIALTPKATELLLLLVVNAGQLVERNVLLKELWPDTFVEESNLTQNIFMLRRALGDERAVPRYIETVTRRGYRFIGSVQITNGDAQPDENPLTQVMEAVLDKPQPVIAVLPFINHSEDTELEYLGEGIAENIINSLSRVSKLRVMSRSAVFRYKVKEDPRLTAKYLGADVVLVGKIMSRPNSVAISVELVDAATGWQLWGESFDSESKDILAIQDAITRQLLATLKLELTGDEEKSVTARYTENAEAYQAYLEGRYHWSRYTKKGIEKAIGHFRQAIELDPNYALAYAGIVDCYLRLATNYLPPEDDIPRPAYELEPEPVDASNPKVKLRFEWDWKGAERELRRANELKSNYPSAHQWYAAYRFSKGVFQKSSLQASPPLHKASSYSIHPAQLFSASLSPNEEVQILCTATREQVEVGNYDAGPLMLSKWWIPGEWPNLEGLSPQTAADLLFTTGSLVGCLSSTGRIQKGQKHAEELLSGSIGIFEHLGARRRSAEAKIELALSYYRQGMFDLTRKILFKVLRELKPSDAELRSLVSIRLGVVERHAGHIVDSFAHLSEAKVIVEECGPLVTGRYHHELATTLQVIAIAEDRAEYLESVTHHFQRAFSEFMAIGHHRYAAVVENNHGWLLLTLRRFVEAEVHLVNSRRLFEGLDDKIRGAQVDDTLARLYIATNQFELADSASQRAVICLERNDEDALLAEALTTRGLVFCKLNRRPEARAVLEGARRVAERCGDAEGAGRALLTLVEEMCDDLDDSERYYLGPRMQELLERTQVASTQSRLEKCLRLISQQKPRHSGD
jgi:TolB-like protein